MALRFLPDDVAKDAQALSRVQREAKAASALNHANICTTHERNDQNGQALMVMEYLDREPLKHRISSKPHALAQVLDEGIEIAVLVSHARTYVLQSDTAKARAAYQDFLTLRKDADLGISILVAAKSEYAKLQSPRL